MRSIASVKDVSHRVSPSRLASAGLLASSLATLTPSGAWAQTWTQTSSTGPSVRSAFGMAYDTARNRTVLFGGNRATTVHLGDTWEYIGATSAWTQVASTGPAARHSGAMVFDDNRNVSVLYGGVLSNGLGIATDTWEWNGSTWTQRFVTGPSTRYYHAMAFDTARNVSVLFGGTLNGFVELGDTWEWNGGVWTVRTTSGPSPRWHTAMAYDPVRDRTVIFGGAFNPTATPDFESYLGDTWEYNGNTATWSLRSSTGPSARAYVKMAFDTSRNRLVLYGGANATSLFSDTWEWNGSSWSQISVSGPGLRAGHGLVYDDDRGRCVLFGGNTIIGAGFAGLDNETWEYGLSGTPPTITQHPQSQTRCAGQSASFFVTASGSPTLTYQWQRNGANVSGATGSAYAVASVAEAHEGNYRCVVTNGFGTATSNQAFLTVNSAPTITQHPVSVATFIGTRVTFTVVATGDGARSYQWQRNGMNIPGATSSSHVISSVRGTDVASYRCVVTTTCGSVTSNSATLTLSSNRLGRR